MNERERKKIPPAGYLINLGKKKKSEREKKKWPSTMGATASGTGNMTPSDKTTGNIRARPGAQPRTKDDESRRAYPIVL